MDKCFASGECDHIIEGTCKMGGQEHFYLEPHGSIVVPGENDEIKIIASTQVLTSFCCLLRMMKSRSLPRHRFFLACVT